MSNARERAEERRQAKLADMQQQIDDGTLTVRKMTAKERADTRRARGPSAAAAGGALRLSAGLRPGALRARPSPPEPAARAR